LTTPYRIFQNPAPKAPKYKPQWQNFLCSLGIHKEVDFKKWCDEQGLGACTPLVGFCEWCETGKCPY